MAQAVGIQRCFGIVASGKESAALRGDILWDVHHQALLWWDYSLHSFMLSYIQSGEPGKGKAWAYSSLSAWCFNVGV